ncbi:MAG: hypothetical protein JNL82_17420 [Myxococcales bacterium]|nr:hypothetical protein [Myxococcales bacterium]
MVKSGIAFTLASALALQPHAAHAEKFSAKQLRTLATITAGRNDSGKLDAAYTLAREAFADQGHNVDFRKAVAREGKAVAELLFERDRADPKRAPAAMDALCWAVFVMRMYEAELASSEEERQKFSPEAARLMSLATDVKAPCAPPPPAVVVKATDPSTPAASATQPLPLTRSVPADREDGPRPPSAIRRSRVQLAVGGVLVTTGVGLAAGVAGRFAAASGARAEIAGLDAQATADGRDLTSDELAAAAAADARAVRLHNTGSTLGVFAALGVVAGIITLALPPRAPARVHARPAGVGVRINF